VNGHQLICFIDCLGLLSVARAFRKHLAEFHTPVANRILEDRASLGARVGGFT